LLGSRERPADFKTRGMEMEAIKNKSISTFLFSKEIITREYFIELWRSVYGKD
jgi:hypothetical protein